VLQEKKIKRVGENQPRSINCRVISATHKNLATEVREKRFREDLFFRLNVIPIVIPALRDRQEDLMLLAEMFLRKFALINGSPAKTFSKDAVQYIMHNKWRGNVRELENTVERAVVLTPDAEVSLEHFMPHLSGLGADESQLDENFGDNIFSVRFVNELPPLDEVVHRYIEFAVEKNGGARDKTAKQIGIDRKTLYKRLRAEQHATQ
jgi:DNA-binding NtrC family response regulator